MDFCNMVPIAISKHKMAFLGTLKFGWFRDYFLGSKRSSFLRVFLRQRIWTGGFLDILEIWKIEKSKHFKKPEVWKHKQRPTKSYFWKILIYDDQIRDFDASKSIGRCFFVQNEFKLGIRESSWKSASWKK